MADEKNVPLPANPLARTIESKLEHLVADVDTVRTLSPEEDRRIRKRIDAYLLPIMAIAYLFQYLDKTCLSYASILGIFDDLHLTGSDYSWAGSIYYFGYLAAVYPAAGILLVRFPVAKVIATSLVIWGAILILSAATHNAAGLLAVRFFLGFTESAIAPGFTAIIAMWYKREEQPIRQGAWFMGNVCAGFFGSLIAYALANVQTIAPWKLVFLVYGAFTIVFAAVVFYFLPDTPHSARWLSPPDRAKALVRIQDNLTSIKSNTWKKSQFLEALGDPNTWFNVSILFLGSIPNSGLGTFQAIIIKGLSFSTLNTLLLQMIGNAFQVVFVLFSIFGSTYFPNSRTYFMAGNMLVAIAGACMVRYVGAEHRVARLMGMGVVFAYAAEFPMVMAMTSSNTGGFTKKTTVGALVFLGYCAGNIIGPNLFFAREAPGYDSGFLAIIICFGLVFGICLGWRWYLMGENRRRDQTGSVPGTEEELLSLTLSDRTDREIPQFRYKY